MLRKWIVLLVLLIIVLSSIYILNHRSNTLFKITGLAFPGQPILVLALDARNTQSVRFALDIFNYQYRNGLMINVGIVFLSEKVIAFIGSYQIYDKDRMRGLTDNEESFNLFSFEGEALSKGELSNIPDSLLHKINPQYGFDNQRIYDEFCRVTDNLGDVPFFSSNNGSLFSDFNCYLFYDEICLCNESVTKIYKIMEIVDNCSKVHHAIIPMFGYSAEEISLIKHNNGFLIDFISLDVGDINRWRTFTGDPLHKHPLNGLIILADKQGKVLLISNKWDDYIVWREGNL